MLNVTVFNLKDLIKYFLIIVLSGIVIIGVFLKVKNLSSNETSNISIITEKIQKISGASLIGILNKGAPVLNESTRQKKEITIESFSSKNILKYELGMLNALKEKIIEEEIVEEPVDIIQESLDELLEEENIETEVQKTTVKENYTAEISSVKIKNTSGYDISEENIDLNYKLTNNKNIIIFHTHTCESYTATEENPYKMSGNFRTTDLNYSVARVGQELTAYLEKLDFNVFHDKTYHDSPAYSGSYDRSYETVSNILKDIDAEMIIDIHRDAIGSDNSYAPTVKINDEIAAQLMFVIGTNAGGLEHENWKNNLSIAIQIQKKANELYPGLFKPISLTKSRYNQNLGNGACLIEVGATGNTLEECQASMKYLAVVLDEVLT